MKTGDWTLLAIDTFPATTQRLESGLTLVHRHLPSTPVVAVDVWVKAGSATEPSTALGAAHFLEHMIFKGTSRLAPGQFDQIIERHGGATNAATSYDYAHYFINVAPPHLDEALPHLADLVMNAAIPEDEFERERDVVLEELRQSQDDPDWLGFQALVDGLYPTHAYGRPILGTEASLRLQTADDMWRFHRDRYQPHNITVVVVGDVSAAAAKALVERSFSTPDLHSMPLTSEPQSDLAPTADVSTSDRPSAPLIPNFHRQQLHLPRLELSRLMMAWHGPGIGSVRDAYGLDVLAVLLGGGRSSRLVRELREERQLVQAIDSSFSLQRDGSLFSISVWLEPQHIADVEQIIRDRLGALVTEPIGDLELQRCKRLLCNDYAFSTETAGQLAGLYGYYSTLAADASLSMAYPVHIGSFQSSDIQQVAKRYVSPDQYAATVIQPAS
ncbi:MAG: pitrilysin family protein [Elainellaceae cyanobacterium]